MPVRYRSNVFFDAYGQRRELDWRNDTDHSTYGEAHWIERGYTGHEMLDNVELIHMNGRVQNPLWGRMLSPDPVLADLELPQGLNPYSYVGNNPGSWTDPTGFAWCEDDYNCTVYGWPGPSPLYWAPSLPGYYGSLPSWPMPFGLVGGTSQQVDGQKQDKRKDEKKKGKEKKSVFCSAEGIGFISGFVGGALGGGAALTELGPVATGVGAVIGGVTGGTLGLIGTNTVGTDAAFGAIGGTNTSITTPVSGAVGGAAGGLVAHGLDAMGVPNVASATGGGAAGGAISGAFAPLIEGVAGGALSGAAEGGAIGAASGATAAAVAAALRAYCGS